VQAIRNGFFNLLRSVTYCFQHIEGNDVSEFRQHFLDHFIASGNWLTSFSTTIMSIRTVTPIDGFQHFQLSALHVQEEHIHMINLVLGQNVRKQNDMERPLFQWTSWSIVFL
jgi:hypothetical protein